MQASGLLHDLDDIVFQVADFEEAGTLAIGANVSEADAALAQISPGLVETGGVEHGSFLIVGNVARSKHKIKFVCKPEFDASLAIVKFSWPLTQAEFLLIPGSGSGKIEHRDVVRSCWSEQRHKGYGDAV